MVRARLVVSIVVVGSAAVAACGGRAPPAREPPVATAAPGTVRAPDPAPRSTGEGPGGEAPAAVFARVGPDLARCYEEGKRAVPTMLNGRATLSVAVDPGGHATCVVVGDDTGLTQAVEDCMSERLARETFAPSRAPWTTEISVVAKDGKLALGAAATGAPTLDTVETHGLPDSAHDVVVALVPRFRACTLEAGSEGGEGLRVVHVGARVAKDGRVACALASSVMPVPEKMRACVVGVLASATFPPPTAPVGLVSVPLKVHGRK